MHVSGLIIQSESETIKGSGIFFQGVQLEMIWKK